MMVQGELRAKQNWFIVFTLLPFSWKERVFASSMICLLLPAGSDLPPFHPVRRSQTSDRGVPSRTHGPCAALRHPCRDWPHQPQSPAIARLPARRGLPQLTLRRGKSVLSQSAGNTVRKTCNLSHGQMCFSLPVPFALQLYNSLVEKWH
jgi:hypothetical protein